MTCWKAAENCLKIPSHSAKLLYFSRAPNTQNYEWRSAWYSNKRLALIRWLIDLAYTYSDKEVFYRKFLDAVNIESLKDLAIIETGDNTLQISCEESDDEIEMYCLMEQGFML